MMKKGARRVPLARGDRSQWAPRRSIRAQGLLSLRAHLIEGWNRATHVKVRVVRVLRHRACTVDAGGEWILE